MALALLAAVAMAIATLAPPAAHAAGCTNSWKNASGGSWYTAANWSKEVVPSGSEEACITLSGSYSVTMTGGSGATVAALTVGGSSGSQLLEVASVCGANPTLTATGGTTVSANGQVVLGSGSCGGAATLAGPITSAGTITIAVGNNEGSRHLNGSLTNTGTLQVNYNGSFEGSKAILKNEGAVKIAEGHRLTMEAESSFINAASGSIAAAGSGYLAVEPKTSFSEAGTTSGTAPVLIRSGALSYTGTGASTVEARGTTTLKGNLASGQNLQIQGVCGENAHIEATESLTNGGAIALGAVSCGSFTNLEAVSGTITNTGSITTQIADKEGSRYLSGNITNKGTLTVEYPTVFEGTAAHSGKEGVLTNEGGTVSLAGAKLEIIPANKFANSAGTIAVNGENSVLQEDSGASFTEGAGTTSGADVPGVVLKSSALTYAAGAGASTIAVRGTGTIAGNISAGQTLLLQSLCGENTVEKASASYTNAGAISLSSISCGGYTDLETAAAATLTNTGSITTLAGNKEGSRYLVGNLINKGTLTTEWPTTFEGATSGHESTLTNEGNIKLENVTLKVQPINTVINQSGEIAATGAGLLQEESSSSFTEGNGKTSGTLPVLLKSDALTYTGSGASTITVRLTGTIAGNISSGQTLQLQSQCGENTVEKASGSYTNAGAITLTSIGCGGYTALESAAAATLTNTGSITTLAGNKEGSRYLVGNLINKGTLTTEWPTTFEGATSGHESTLTNEGNIKLENVTLKVQPINTVINQSGEIAATGAGLLQEESSSSFTEAAGKTSGNPVLLKSDALTYTGKGASTINFRGEGTLSGEIAKGQALILSSVCGTNTTVKASSVKNSGTVKMTDESCGGFTDFALGSGVFTNDGKLYIEAGNHEGSREIEGELLNEKTLYLVNWTLHVKGPYTQGKKGTLEPYVTTNSEYGVLSATGAASLLGKLTLKQGKTLSPPEGQTFEILKSATRTGEFTKVTGNKVKKSTLLFVPHYLTNGVKLIVEP